MEAQWSVVDAMLGIDFKKELVQHQIDSFDDFVSTKISNIIDGFNPMSIFHGWDESLREYRFRASIEFCDPKLTRPTSSERNGSRRLMTPDKARERHFTYAGDLLADITVMTTVMSSSGTSSTSKQTFSAIRIGRIPIMVYSSACVFHTAESRVGSNMCPMDAGGYFIISGNERVIVSQDRMSENRIFVFPVNKTVVYRFASEVRSLVSEKFGVPKLTTAKLSTKPNMAGHYVHVSMHRVSTNIPLFIILFALGLPSHKSIYEVIKGNHSYGDTICNYIHGCGYESTQNNVWNQEDAIAWISSRSVPSPRPDQPVTAERRQSPVYDMLSSEFLPHTGSTLSSKIPILADMVRRVVLVGIGITTVDDRDSYVCKRIDPPGTLLANLLRQYYGKFAKEVRKHVIKEVSSSSVSDDKSIITPYNVSRIIRPSIIENGIRFAMATGNWGVKNNAKVGVSQVLNRMTYSATLSHLRRVCTCIDKNSKLINPRKLHASQWGVFCPAETPEGQCVGVVKNMSIGTRITLAVDPSYCIDLIKKSAFGDLGSVGSQVCVNYLPVGYCADPYAFTTAFRQFKRSGGVHVHTSIVYDSFNNQVRILMDGGRIVRPILVVREDGSIPALESEQTWSQMILGGCVEYLDVEEVATSMVAMSPSSVSHHSYCEIHPSLMLGVLASMIPFPDHNQSPRNSYQSAMGKQAIGIFASNYRHRFDTHMMMLEYPHRPIVTSVVAEKLGLNMLPCGGNLMVAVSTIMGYNQEDSVVLNQSSIERGMFSSTSYHTIYDQIQRNSVTGEEEEFYVPKEEDVKYSPHDFSKLNESGFPSLERYVKGGDVVIGKCMNNRSGVCSEESTALRSSECGKVDKIFSTLTDPDEAVNGDGYSFVSLRLRDSRFPVIGDKMSSRSGQKGTVGMTLRQEDMPFTSEGMVPDLIINPHALPSRMTIGQVMEGVMGKACCHYGKYGDATPFSDTFSTSSVFDALSRAGMECHGEEVMHDPRTGEMTATTVFLTPTYYQRLKHMVCDKVHGRGGSGPMVSLTRQPAEGRARDGGLRMGEMETECLLAHGQMKFLKERFMDCSDGFDLSICRGCGTYTPLNILYHIHKCSHCGNNRDFSVVEIPYSMKLFMQEAEGMGITPKLITSMTSDTVAST